MPGLDGPARVTRMSADEPAIAIKANRPAHRHKLLINYKVLRRVGEWAVHIG